MIASGKPISLPRKALKLLKTCRIKEHREPSLVHSAKIVNTENRPLCSPVRTVSQPTPVFFDEKLKDDENHSNIYTLNILFMK